MSVNSINFELMKNILTQMKNSVLRIKLNKCTNTGFLCKIPFPDKNNLLKVMITFTNLSKDDIIKCNKIHISLDDEKKSYEIYVEEKRKIYVNKLYNIAIIEIRKNDKFEESAFLEIDESIFDNKQNELKDMQVYLMGYPYQKNGVFSHGVITKLKEDGYTLNHLCATSEGCAGSPIMSNNSLKVVGIHIGYEKNKNYNYGIFLKKPIEEFNEMFK